MCEDYKKIAFEDVKVGQKVRIVEECPAYDAMYEGVVVQTDSYRNTIDLGRAQHKVTIYVSLSPNSGFSIFLLEDAPEPKVVRTETVTITHYDDGTTTQTSVDAAPMVIKTMEQFEEYEEYLKTMILSDRAGDYWKHDDIGGWGWRDSRIEVSGGAWHFHANTGLIHDNLPMTVVENVGV